MKLKSRQIGTLSAVLIFGLLTTLLFQNCSKIKFTEASLADNQTAAREIASESENFEIEGIGPAPKAIPSFSLSEKNLSFGQVDLKSTNQRVVVLKNTSSVPLTVQAIALSDSSEFDLSSTDCSSKIQAGQELSPNQICNLVVRFAPIVTGQKSRHLKVQFENLEHQTVEISGEGIPELVVVEPLCRNLGTLTKPPQIENLCINGTVAQYEQNAQTSRYTWKCQGTQKSIDCAASFFPERFCNYAATRDGVNYTSSEGDIYLRHVDGSSSLVKTCTSNVRGAAALPNGGMNCADFNIEATCCSDNRQVSINGKCVTPAPEGAYCYAMRAARVVCDALIIIFAS